MDLEGQDSGTPGLDTQAQAPAAAEPTQAAPDTQATQPQQPTADGWDYGGQKLDPMTTNQLIHLGLLFQNAIIKDNQGGQPPAESTQPQAQPQPQAQQPQQQPGESMKQFLDRLERIEKRLEQDHQERQRNALLKETEEAIQAAESLKPHMSDDTRRKALLGMTATYMAQTGSNPRQAAKFVNDFVNGIEESAKAKYLSGKVQQAARKVEGRVGSSPAVSSNPRNLSLADKGVWDGAAEVFAEFANME
jgi:hypothetical protein